MASQMGTLFRISTFGESHGPAVGVVIDGCPPLLHLPIAEIQKDLDRRRPGQSRIVTQRKEGDEVEILSGVEDGRTTGTSICLLVRNTDQRSRDYDEMREKYRPSHADFTYDQKFGIRSVSGGGRASARETIGRVAAGAVARLLLRKLAGVEVLAWVERVQGIWIDSTKIFDSVTEEQIEANIVRCPDQAKAEEMLALIESVRKDGDSVGGAIACVCRSVPAGLGEPVFDKLEADLAKAMMSLPASKSFEVGSGIPGTLLKGSEHNDAFRVVDGKVVTRGNHSGGIQGGISNGMPITMRVGFKPVATIMHEQDTVDIHGQETTIRGKGRHDPCVLPRAVPMVEAMACLVLADHLLRQRAIR